jgi:hypothetical protein
MATPKQPKAPVYPNQAAYDEFVRRNIERRKAREKRAAQMGMSSNGI